jgi:signal transduction histidine kinase
MDIRIYFLTAGFLFMALITLGFGLFVWLKNRRALLNILWGLFSFVLFIWSLSFAVAINMTNEKIAYYVWFFNLANIFNALLFSHIALRMTMQTKEKKRTLIGLYLIGLIIFFACLFWPHNFLPRIIPKMYFKYYLDAGPLYYLIVVFFICAISYAFYQLIKTVRQTKDEITRNRLKYIIIGAAIGYITACPAFLLVFNIKFDPITAMFVGFSYLVLTYAIIKHHLLDINVVIKKTLIYSVIIALIAGLMVAVSFLGNWFMTRIPGFQFWIIPLMAGVTAFIIGGLFWKKSREADKLKYEFIRVAAHKLRTPLTHIKWAIEGFSEKAKTDEEKKLIHQINSSNEQLIKLANALLNASQVEYKDLYKLSPVSLEEIGREILLSFQVQTDAKKIEIIFNVDKNLPKINTDEEKIGAVIQTLLGNAIMYTPNGGEIQISIEEQKNNLVFSIKDNGIGIIKEEQPYIFSRFFRSHRAESIQTEGLGLGLFLVKNIVERLGGKIWFDSKGENKGAQFWFSLPLETL